MTIKKRSLCSSLAAALVSAAAVATPPPTPFAGVTLAGGDFAPDKLPGVHGTNYHYPAEAELRWAASEGFTVVRVPFRWERLQPAAFGPLHPPDLKLLDATVAHAKRHGLKVIFDAHNYGRYYPDGGPAEAGPTGRVGVEVPVEAFADFWGRVAERYREEDHLIFALMNEPHDQPLEAWVEALNAAIAAIRDAGAPQKVLVSGTGWSGANNWFRFRKDPYERANAQAILDVRDPADRWAVEVHQYLDFDGGGNDRRFPQTVDAGLSHLIPLTAWLKEHGISAVLGEFAVPAASCGDGPDQLGDEAIAAMLDHLHEHADVWDGWVWWAAGAWWLDDYDFDLTPDKPAGAGEVAQMPVLRRYMPVRPAVVPRTDPEPAE